MRTRIGWRVVAPMNCSSRVNSSLTGCAGLDHGQRHDVLDQHFLLGAEAATHALAEHADLCRIEIEKPAQRPPREKRRLRARPDVEATRFVEPADRAVRFQMRMLDALRDIGGLVDDVGLRKALVDIADMAVDLGHDIAPRVVDARLRPLVVEDRCAGLHRGFRIEHRRKQVVIDARACGSPLRPRPRFRQSPPRRAGR